MRDSDSIEPLPQKPLPIDTVLPDLAAALIETPNAVLQAPPGAGKTTRVPLALLDAPWRQDGRIIMLEPRRLAARAAARRLASQLGEPVGARVGYRVRLDSKVSDRTRIEVVTEGILTRRLQRDPALEGVAAVLFDEVHERSLQTDLGLALCLETQAALRPDLRIVAMSATLATEAFARVMGDAPIVTSAGRAFPVETRYLGAPRAARGGGRAPPIEPAVADAVRTALAEDAGSILVFLPGTAEIRRVQGLLGPLGPDIEVAPLFGDLPAAAQDRAIRPPEPGWRKVVLATAIAETSLTIEGVRVVIDSGLARRPAFDPRTGMSRLQTVRVSKAAAEQRRGRAGRTEPGVCYRLWDAAGEGALAPFDPPEILSADLAPLCLELAAWGATPGDLTWLDPPPSAALGHAAALLHDLGALDGQGRITPHGRALTEVPTHPRLAHMLSVARSLGALDLGTRIAALLEDRDLLGAGAETADLAARLARLQRPGPDLKDRAGRTLAQAKQLRRLAAGGTGGGAALRHVSPDAVAGALLAAAYPERVAERIGEERGMVRYRMAGGGGARLSAGDPLATAPFLAVADLDGARDSARIYVAAALDRATLDTAFAHRIAWTDEIRWDRRTRSVRARRVQRLGAVVLEDGRLRDPDPSAVTAALIEGVRDLGLAMLPWSDAAIQLRARIALLQAHDPEVWPAMTDAGLLADLEHWLAPFVGGVERVDAVPAEALVEGLLSRVGWERKADLDRLAPTHLSVPSGSRIRLDYTTDPGPALAVRLQEMFGATETPSVLDGVVPVTLHLLSPGQRPVQVTRDLISFWANGYPAVKAELRGRYIKHHWPDDPYQAAPTRSTKRRSG